jgi:hypothetical protein
MSEEKDYNKLINIALGEFILLFIERCKAFNKDDIDGLAKILKAATFRHDQRLLLQQLLGDDSGQLDLKKILLGEYGEHA